MTKNKTLKYIREYTWRNIFSMIRNNGKDAQVCVENCNDKLVVITGATSGIGLATARKYASQGAHLVCINRSVEKSEKLKLEIETTYGVQCDYIIADLSSLAESFKVANELKSLTKPIDVIIHNAGIFLTKRKLTVESFEKVFAIHYLSSFIINYCLKDKLKSQEKARIIMVGSEGHRFAPWGLQLNDLNWEKRRYSGLMSYGSAKLAQMLSMLVFADYFKDTGVTIISMHPGAVKSETGKDNGPIYRWYKKNVMDRTLKSADCSAEALYYLGISSEVDNNRGKFFNLTTLEDPAPPALDKEEALELWKMTLKMTGLE
ncbi:MAG TPA: SDR family NAD(P)-dependent oxidoreductase [Paludibacter sp.]|nr:SDR family NAD(P)-dependent oxidoreductase [Paludibacter sp.]